MKKMCVAILAVASIVLTGGEPLNLLKAAQVHISSRGTVRIQAEPGVLVGKNNKTGTLQKIVKEGNYGEWSTLNFTLEAEQIEYNLGTVPTGTTKQQTVTIRNSGSTVFKLKGFTTSCDCTEATCDWQELPPGENGTFTVSYQAEEPGDFYRTVEIYGNIPDNALQFSFIGTVK